MESRPEDATVRVTLRREGAELVAETTGSQSSSRLMSLAGAQALVRIAPGDQGMKAGSGLRRSIVPRTAK